MSHVQLGEIYKVFTGSDIRCAIMKLKHSIGPDCIHSNHLKLCTSLFEDLLAVLFSSFISHVYISLDLIKGIINPTLKDRFGDLQSSDNYRPVMSSSVILKLFEYCLLDKISDFFVFNDRQYGFRNNHSTSSACFVLKETVLCYMNANSSVHACFLDIQKAFDNVNHMILLEKLREYGIPDIYINIIKYWYSNQFVRVRYGTKFSSEWMVCNGVRQGGVLSGLFFNLYIDSLLSTVSEMKIGCRLGITMSNIIAYADDIVLLAPSATALQLLIDKCVNEASKLQLAFNENKSKCMVFKSNSRVKVLSNRYLLNGSYVEIVKSFKYLGYFIQDNLCNAKDITETMNRFYREFNIVLRKFNFADSSVKLYLFKQCCLQFYGCEMWFANERALSQLSQFAVAYHKAIKKLLGLSMHESNHYACQEARLFTFEHMLNKIRIFFVYRLLEHPCPFLEKTRNFFRIIISFVSGSERDFN